MDIQPTTPVATAATRHPETLRVFQRHDIDFCCGGKHPIAEACAEKGLDVDALMAEIEAVLAEGPPERNWSEASLTELVEHIVGHYHGKLREDLPRLEQMAEKVLSVHGEEHSELAELATTFRALKAELESHMAKEEQILFPATRRLEELGGQAGPMPPLSAPIGVMEDEHASAARALERMAELTGGFDPPQGACTTFRGLYHGLQELTDDLHHHIHLENNILFPRAERLQAELSGVPA